MIYCYIQELIEYQNDKSKKLNFDKIFLNTHFSITIAYKYFKLCVLSLHIHSEGNVSQIFNLGLRSLFYVQKRETFSKMCKDHF